MVRQGFFPAASLTLVQAPPARLAQCGLCGLFKTCHSPKMPVFGDGKRGVLIVAEAPGKDEDRRGRPLIGPAGQLFRGLLRKCGIDLDRDCWATNSLICRPPKNASPTDAQIGYCRPNLLNTIRELQPTTIILAGGSPVRSLIGSLWKDKPGEIGLWAGWQIPSQRLNAWICPTYHPSYLLRMERTEAGKVLRVLMLQQLQSALALEGRPWDAVPDYRQRVELLHSPRDAARAVRAITSAGKPTAFDYETNMLKPDGSNAEILCCSLCNSSKRAIAFPWVGRAVDAVRDFLRSPVPKIASNLKFEDRWSVAKLGVRPRNWQRCTMLSAHALDNRRGITSIKFQSFVLLGMDRYNHALENQLKSSGNRVPNNAAQEIELDHLLLYCGLDSLLELLVARIQENCFRRKHDKGPA